MSEPTKSAYQVLRPKHQAFVAAYCTCWNAAAAARAAGYATRRANNTGWDLLQRPDVRAAVEERLKQNQLDTASTALSHMLQANMGNYMRLGEDGLPGLDFEKLKRDEMSFISELLVESRSGGAAGRDGVVSPASEIRKMRFRLSDKLAAGKAHRSPPGNAHAAAPTRVVTDHDRAKAILALLTRMKKEQELRALLGNKADEAGTPCAPGERDLDRSPSPTR